MFWFLQDVEQGLATIGHNITLATEGASVVSVANTPFGWNPVYDPRKIGEVAGF